MEKNLDAVRTKLYEAFETAVTVGRKYNTSGIGPENLKAAARLADAIVNVEARIESQQSDKNTLKLPGKP